MKGENGERKRKEKERKEWKETIASCPSLVSYVTWVFAWHMLVTSRDAHVMRRDVDRPKGGHEISSTSAGWWCVVCPWIEGEEITASKEK